MTQFSINTLRAAIEKPARSHLFRCFITPTGLIGTSLSIFTGAFGPGNDAQTRSYLCKIATIPEIVVETGEVYYFTRAVKYPTRRRYTPLTLTFFNTTDYTLREAFERWNEVLLNPFRNEGFSEFGNLNRATQGTATINIQHYTNDAIPVTFAQISSSSPPTQGTMDGNNLLRNYTFYQAYPSSIGPLTFSYDNDTEIQTFDVTMEYNYFVGTNELTPNVNTSEEIQLPSQPENKGN